MEAAAGLTASQRAIDIVKSMPLWLLAGLCVSLLVIWSWPPLLAAVPPSVQPWIPVALLVGGIFTVCRLVAATASHVIERRHMAAARDRQKLIHLYRPLTVLFLTRHITSSSTAAPRLRLRIIDAWDELGSYRSSTVALKRAWRTLVATAGPVSAEVEYGGGFPLAEIIKLVHSHPEYADDKLLNLISRADRSRYEEAGTDLLTEAEYALFDYIETVHSRLSRRCD